MGSLLHPVGSQPSWVYWARRGAVVLAAVVLVAVGIAVFSPQPDGPVAAVPVTPSPSPAASTPGTTPTDSASPTPSPTPTGPLACDATNSTLTLAAYQKVKQKGRQPIRLGITNNGDQPCVLDLKPQTLSLTVTSGSDRIWSTEDCAKWVPTHKQSLKAGKAYEFTVVWSVSRSAPGCKTPKAVLGPGTYVVSAAFAADAKARQVFLVTKAG